MALAKVFAAGALLGAGVVLVALALIIHSYASSLDQAAWRTAIANYTSLLDEARELLREINASHLVVLYSRLAGDLPEMEKALAEYRALYSEVEKHKELILQAYMLTHSAEYNETLRELREILRSNDTLLALLLGPFLEKIAGYMEEAQPLTSEALHLVEAVEQNPPEKLQSYLRLAEKAIEAMPPEKLNETMARAEALLEKASELLGQANTTSWGSSLETRLRDYSVASLIAGSGMVAASIIIAYSLWREESTA